MQLGFGVHLTSPRALWKDGRYLNGTSLAVEADVTQYLCKNEWAPRSKAVLTLVFSTRWRANSGFHPIPGTGAVIHYRFASGLDPVEKSSVYESEAGQVHSSASRFELGKFMRKSCRQKGGLPGRRWRAPAIVNRKHPKLTWAATIGWRSVRTETGACVAVHHGHPRAAHRAEPGADLSAFPG